MSRHKKHGRQQPEEVSYTLNSLYGSYQRIISLGGTSRIRILVSNLPKRLSIGTHRWRESSATMADGRIRSYR